MNWYTLPRTSTKAIVTRRQYLRMTDSLHQELQQEVNLLRERLRIFETQSNSTAIVRDSHDAIFSESLDGTVLSWNKAAEILFGQSEHEIVGRSTGSIIPHDRADELQRIRDGIVRGERFTAFDTVRLQCDGTPISVLLSVSPLLNDDGAVVGVSNIIRDLNEIVSPRPGKAARAPGGAGTDGLGETGTSRHGPDAELALVQRRLQRITEELESLGYAISHDVRAPLRAMRGFAGILWRRQRDALDEQGRKYLDNIVEAGSQMEELIENLLIYARMGRRGVDYEVVSIVELFEQLLIDQSQMIEAQGATVEVDGDLPPVIGDASLLYQVFGNLLINAITYHEDNVLPKVEVAGYRLGNRAVVTVRDHGIGIKQDYHHKLFNLFQRLHTAREYPGTGIGLGIVKKAVELLDGRIWLESSPGNGATFFVELPANPNEGAVPG